MQIRLDDKIFILLIKIGSGFSRKARSEIAADNPPLFLLEFFVTLLNFAETHHFIQRDICGMKNDNEKNNKNVRKTIFYIFLIIDISLILILFDHYICNSCVDILKEYNEMIMKMPIAPKPEYLISELIYKIIVMCFANSIAGFVICIIIKTELGSLIQSKPSEYQKYLLNLINGLDSGEYKNKDRKDVIQRMLNNNKEITEYFEMSKNQEKISYIISISGSVFGFIILVIAIVCVLYSARIEVTVIIIISGALTEIISGLVLWIHGKSAEQLNHYYGALHENEKFLSAINLADKLEDLEKKKMYIEIIKAQIKANEENEK